MKDATNKIINLIVFNERYFDENLIYTQNILPLIKLMNEKKNIKIRMYTFTSIILLLTQKRKISKFKESLRKNNVKVFNLPTLFYPTRLLILRWYIYPFFLLNVFPYMLYFNLRDILNRKKTNIYNTRSYPASLAFLQLYYNKKRLIFDPRTDWIIEILNLGVFSDNCLSLKLWKNWEKKILLSFGKSLFISESFKFDVLKRNNLSDNNNRYLLQYNLIDYNLFTIQEKTIKRKDFLYTGSLGHWNNINLYLDFFLTIFQHFPDSNLIIITNTNPDKLLPEIENPRYKQIKDRVKIEFKVPVFELKNFYRSCGFGLQLMSKKDSRVGVKFIEYIAAGICPIVNKNVRGAVELSEKFKIGVVIDNDFQKTDKHIKMIKNTPPIERNSANYIQLQKETDINFIAEKLEKIYLHNI